MDVNEVLKAVKGLPPAELRKVSAQAAHMLLQGKSSTSPLEQEVYENLCDTLKMEGIQSYPPFGAFARTNGFPAFRDGVGLFLQYIDQYCKPMTRLERLKMINVFLKMLARRLCRDGIPLSSKTLSSALSRIGSVVDDQFPGYRESGLLPVLLKKYQIR